MKKIQYIVAIVALLMVGLAPVVAQTVNTSEPQTDKRAQTGFKFLAMSPDARGAALGDALTAEETNSAVSAFYNPAGMANQATFLSVMAGQTQWIADINYNLAAVSIAPAGGRYGVFAIQAMTTDYGDVIGTVRADNPNGSGYYDYSELGLADPSPTAYVFGLSYARALSDRFSVGGTVKRAHQDLDVAAARGTGTNFEVEEAALSSTVFDLGVLYKTGFRSLNFAMSVRNFARELKYVDDTFELPLTFRIGVAMDLVDLTNLDRNMHSLRLLVDAERPRDFDEQIKVGGEYTLFNTLSLRAGYTTPTDIQGVNLGAGIHHSFGTFGFSADYSYSQMSGGFDPVNRFTVGLSF